MGDSGLPIGLLRYKIAGTELTPRERKVLRLLAMGHSHGSAAQELGVSRETVRTQTKMARARLGAKTTAQAVAIAISLDLI